MNEWHSESCLAYIQIASYLYSNSVLPTIQQKTSKYATLNLDPGSWSKDRLQGRIGSFSSSKTSPRMFSWNSFIMGWKPYAFLKCWKTNKIQREYFKEEVPPPKSCVYWNLVSKPPITITLQRRAVITCCHLHQVTFTTEGKCFVKVNDAPP